MTYPAEKVESPERVGEIVAAHRLASDILILLGWSADEMARDGIASLDRNRRERGRFRAASWMSEDGRGERWFVAAIRVGAAGEAAPGESLRLHGAGARAPIIACLPQLIVDAPAFAAELGVRLGRGIDEAALFLLETFSNRASRRLQAVSAFLAAILDVAAEEDGVIEILGAVEGEGLMLQGWSRHPSHGQQRLFLVGDGLEEHDAVTASFARKDLEAPAAGLLALLRSEEVSAAAPPSQVYLRLDGGFRRLAVLPNSIRLHHDQSPSHLRDMLAGLRCDEAGQRAFRAAARPRFTGHDTVSTLDRPVRMAVDVAAPIAGAGWYLTGWLLDPMSLVTAVTLRGTDGSAERLDQHWTRVPREDVSNGFRAAPLFESRIAHDLHGFTVFVPSPGGRDAWLELTLVGDHYVFMPLHPMDADGHAGRIRLLSSFDIHKPSARDIVERHLGPLFHAAKGSPKRPIRHRVLRRGNAIEPAGKPPDAALLVPLTGPDCRTAILVADLASRPPGEGVAPLIICTPEIGERSVALLRELDFYGLDAAVILAEESVDPCTALELGATVTRAPALVFLSPSAHPVRAGWAATLVAGLEDAAAVSPTLLYEDWSVRYAGIEGVRFLETQPYAEVATARAGYPRGAVAASASSPTLAASLECCALRRDAFEAVDGFSRGYALPAQGGLDLFLRMRAAGHVLRWVPEIEVYALDDAGAGETYWARTGEMVDGWSLRASWRDELPPLADGAEGDPIFGVLGSR